MQPQPQSGPNQAPPGITETIAKPLVGMAGAVAGGLAVRTVVDMVLPGAVTTTAIVSGATVAAGVETFRVLRDRRNGELVEPGFWRIVRRIGGAAVRGAIIGGAASFGVMGIEGIIGQEPLAAGLAGAVVGGAVSSVVSGLREANRVHNGGAPETRRQKTTRVLKAAGKGAAFGGVISFGLGGGIGWAAEHASSVTDADWLPWNHDSPVTTNPDGGSNNADGGSAGSADGGDSNYTPTDGSNSTGYIRTGELGEFDTSEDPGVQPEIDPETGFLGGTGSDAAARALQESYSHAHSGAELNWAELRQDPGFESAYHDFMGNVLNDNGMEWGDDTHMLASDHLKISEGTLDKFLDDMDVNDTTGDSLTTADFAPGEFGDTHTTAFLSHVDDYVRAIAEHNPELASNPVHYGDYADGYLTYLHNQDPALYEAYANMHPAAQMQYMADLLARLAEESDELTEATA